MILIIKHIQLSLYLTPRVWVSVFIGFDLLFVQCLRVLVFVCVCVLSEAQFSCLVWCADGWVGACWMRYPFSFLCLFICPCFLFSSPLLSSFFCWVSFTSYIPGCLLSFIAASAEGHLGQRRVFHRSIFSLPSSLCVSQGSVRQLYAVALEWNVS